ncbi:glycosyltransferase family 2 protein [Halococcus saccharolyticus]|nr:glycosyltransferase family 2 protein [Halococcus saccharolyticus]
MSLERNTGAENAPKPPTTAKEEVSFTTPQTDSDSISLVARDDEQQPTVSVVMPTLNEEEGIGECIASIKHALSELEITGEIIVSDSSTDRTPQIAAEMGAFVVTPDRSGYGYAYRYAFEYVRGEYVVIGDADTTYDFEELPDLFEIVARGDADVVMGSRLAGNILPGSMPALHKYVGNPLLTKFLNLFYGAGVSDAHSGFRVFRKEVIDTLSLRTNGMEFASEMVMAAGANDLQIAEVPITYHERQGEATLSSFRDGWRHVKFMAMNAPGLLFSVPAFGLFSAGVLTMAASLFGLTLGGIVFGSHTVIAGSLLTIVGYQIGGLAVFSSVTSSPVRPQRDPITGWLKRRFQLEYGLAIGLALIALGGGYTVFLLGGWIASGYTQRPLITSDMLAFTTLVLGAQTFFSSFFLGLLHQPRSTASPEDESIDSDETDREGYGA